VRTANSPIDKYQSKTIYRNYFVTCVDELYPAVMTTQYAPSVTATLQQYLWQYEGLKSSSPGPQMIKKVLSQEVVTAASSEIVPGNSTT
jgi:hypothetical protein